MGGADKARLAVGGALLLDRATEALSAATRVAIAGGSRIAPADLPDRTVLGDPKPNRGPLAGIAAALAWAEAGGAGWLMTAPVDAPFLTPSVYDALLGAAAASGDAEAAIAVADGRDQWLAAVLRPGLASAALRALGGQDLSVAHFLGGRRLCRVAIDGAANAFMNVNTSSDLEAAQRLAAAKGAAENG